MFKFKIEENKFRRAEAHIKKQLKLVLSDQKVMQEIGTVTTDRIRYQARIGKPVNDTNTFPALAESTISNRKYLLRYNQNHPTAKAKRSNITITGNFLDSLSYDYISPGLLQIYFKGDHVQYRGKNGQLIGKVIRQETLLGYLKQKGFSPFSGLALNKFEPLKSRIRNIVKAALRRSL